MYRFASVLVRPLAATLVLACAAAHAQAQDVPFTGVVVEDNTPIRAGASQAYYVVGELPRGATVQVREVLYGWNLIAVPDGVYSYISKGFVDVRGDGKTGVVNQDAAVVKAASIKGPGESYRVQVRLNKGEAVQIVGEDGSFYRIVPPKDAAVFVRPGAIQRAEQAMQPAREPAPQPTRPVERTAPPRATQAAEQPANGVTVAEPVDLQPGEAATGPATLTAPQPVDLTQVDPSQMVPAGTPVESAGAEAGQMQTPTEGQTQQIDEAPADPTAPETELAIVGPATQPSAEGVIGEAAAATIGADDVDSPAQSPVVRAIEARYAEAIEQPIEQQPIEQLIEAYESAQQDPNLAPIDRQIVAMRIAGLQQNLRVAQAIRRIEQARAESDRSAAQRRPIEQYAQPKRWDLTGKLLTSSVYNGVNLPLMYRLVDIQTGRTLAYVRPGTTANARSLLNRNVGVIGSAQVDPVLNYRIIDVKEIEALAE